MTPDDREVVGAVRNGDRDAFGILIQRYQHRLFGLVLMMVRDRTGAEDVTQDTFVRAFVHLDLYDDNRPLYPWLAAIAARLSQNWLRQRIRTRDDRPLEGLADTGMAESVLAGLLCAERDEGLWRAVSALTSGERTAVTLFYRDGLAVGEIAAALGVTTGTIKTLLFRARRRLRERLAPSPDASEKC